MARGDGNVAYEHQAGTVCRDKQHRSCSGRWRGVVNRTVDGKRRRYTVDGSTKTEATRKLKAKVAELDGGVRPDGTYTVRQCCDEWLSTGLDGKSPKTVSTYREALAPVLAEIGGRKLDRLSVRDVETALQRAAATRSTRTVQIAALSLERALQRAVKHRLISFNPAAEADRPSGKTEGRPSRAMTRGVLELLLSEAEADGAVGAYTIVAAMTGCRPEELRALAWDSVDLDAGTIRVWRSDRHGGDTKTTKSKRSLAIPQRAVQALLRRQEQQQQDHANAAELWHETGLVFTTTIGTMLDPHNLRREFRNLCDDAGIGRKWSPRELRHTFVSILSEAGVPLEEIARLAGHSTSRTTETVYRRELREQIGTGATVMDSVFPVRQELSA